MESKDLRGIDNSSTFSSLSDILILFFFRGDFPGQAKVTFFFFKVKVVSFPECLRNREETLCHRFCTCS